MRPLSDHALIRVWEQGLSRHPIERALLLLADSLPHMSKDDLAALTIGQRNDLLIQLRSRTLGRKLISYAVCPQCKGALEFTLNDDLFVMEPLTRLTGEITQDDYHVVYRLPNSRDLATAARQGEVAAAREVLIECCLSAQWAGQAIHPLDLPDELIATIGAAMSDHDVLADITLNLHCDMCAHNWITMLDIVPFFWKELEVRAYRLMDEVHALALAYKWHEADILSMSATRRAYYLGLPHG